MTTVIIPTRNESENIAELKRRLPKGMDVLIVDDSPNTETVEAARSVGFKTCYGRGRGLSAAVIEGINRTNGGKVIVMDADLQHPPEAVAKLDEALDVHDAVVASRLVEGGRDEGLKGIRKLISYVANLLALPLCPKVRDRTSGFFGFRREMVDSSTLSAIGYKIGLEIMVKGHYDTIVEVPYTFALREHGESNLTKKVMFEYLKQLIGLYLYKFRFLRFMLVGGLGTLTNLLVLFLITHFAGIHYMASFGVAFLIAATQNYCLNKQWTFGDRNEASLGYLRYMLAASATLVLDETLLYLFTDVCGIWYLLSAVIAIVIAFAARYVWISKWIWGR